MIDQPDDEPEHPLANCWTRCSYMLNEPPADAAEILSDALGVPAVLLEDVVELPDTMDGLRRFMRHSSLLEGPGDGR
jgi:hypothetical protein